MWRRGFNPSFFLASFVMKEVASDMCFYQALRCHRQYRSTKTAASHINLPATLYNNEKVAEVAAAECNSFFENLLSCYRTVRRHVTGDNSLCT
jgi:hypothetical protein